MDLIGVYLGEALGLYGVLAKADRPITASELAERAGIMPRYAREWLEHQAVAGFLTCTDASAGPDERTFSMSDDAVPILADPDAADYFAPFARAVVLSAAAAREMPDVYRGLRTFGWEDHGPDMRRAQGDANRPAFLGALGSSWFPAITDVHERLSDAATPARVADVGCGEGWSSIAMALAYPNAHIDGYDIDVPSITAARLHAEGKGVSNRARFHVEDLSDASIPGTYDLVTAFECIHDMSDPVAALRAMRQLRAPGGTVVIADELACRDVRPGRRRAGARLLRVQPVGVPARLHVAGAVRRDRHPDPTGHDARVRPGCRVRRRRDPRRAARRLEVLPPRRLTPSSTLR